MMLIQHSVNSDWLFNTQSRVLQTDWLMLENNEKATLNINIYPITTPRYSVCKSDLLRLNIEEYLLRCHKN